MELGLELTLEGEELIFPGWTILEKELDLGLEFLDLLLVLEDCLGQGLVLLLLFRDFLL